MNRTFQTRKIIQLSTLAAACLMVASEVSAQTLLLQWKFDESETGTEAATDSGAAPAASGTFTGATRVGTTPNDFSTGAMNSTGAAVGNLKYVVGGDVNKLDGLTNFTLTTWVNVQEVPAGNRRIISKQAAGSFAGFSWNIGDVPDLSPRSAANFGTRLFVGGTKGFFFDVSPTTVDADNKWVFLAVSYDGNLTENNVQYYIGGVATAPVNQGTTSIDAGPTVADSAAIFGIGYTDAAPAGNTGFPGWMDDVRVYSGVLDAAALDAVRLQNLEGSTANAVLITNTSRSGNTVTFSFDSQSGKSHAVEYKNSITDASWTPLTTIPGDGSSKLVTDSNATTSARFYRVVTQ